MKGPDRLGFCSVKTQIESIEETEKVITGTLAWKIKGRAITYKNGVKIEITPKILARMQEKKRSLQRKNYVPGSLWVAEHDKVDPRTNKIANPLRRRYVKTRRPGALGFTNTSMKGEDVKSADKTTREPWHKNGTPETGLVVDGESHDLLEDDTLMVYHPKMTDEDLLSDDTRPSRS